MTICFIFHRYVSSTVTFNGSNHTSPLTLNQCISKLSESVSRNLYKGSLSNLFLHLIPSRLLYSVSYSRRWCSSVDVIGEMTAVKSTVSDPPSAQNRVMVTIKIARDDTVTLSLFLDFIYTPSPSYQAVVGDGRKLFHRPNLKPDVMKGLGWNLAQESQNNMSSNEIQCLGM